MGNAFTPGPYLRDGKTVYALTDYGRGPENRWSAHVQRDGQGRCPEEEVEAVATLFEAAPDLLEALHGMLVFYGMDEDPDEVSGTVHRKARAAIARARGEAP